MPHSLEDVGFRLMVPHVEAAIGICNGLLVKITPHTIMIPTGGKEVVVGEEDAEGDVVSLEELLTQNPSICVMKTRVITQYSGHYEGLIVRELLQCALRLK